MKFKPGIKNKTAQDVQDEIFRRMSAEDKIELGSDFYIYGLKRGFSEGTPVPMDYLKRWLKGRG